MNDSEQTTNALPNSNADATTTINSRNDSRPWPPTSNGSRKDSENAARVEALAIVDEMIEETRMIRRMVEELQHV